MWNSFCTPTTETTIFCTDFSIFAFKTETRYWSYVNTPKRLIVENRKTKKMNGRTSPHRVIFKQASPFRAIDFDAANSLNTFTISVRISIATKHFIKANWIPAKCPIFFHFWNTCIVQRTNPSSPQWSGFQETWGIRRHYKTN